MALTGNKNLDTKILNRLSDSDLVSVCEVNKKAHHLCNDQTFWLNRILTKFPYLRMDILNKYKGYRSWSDYYTKDLRKIYYIFESVENNREDRVLVALNNRGDPNIKNRFGQTPLVKATQKGNFDMVKLLLDYGANPNIQTHTGSNALITAAGNGYLEIVKLLLEKGADIHQSTIGGAKILFLTILSRPNPNYDVVKYLLEKRAEVNTRSPTGQTPLTYAEEKGLNDMVKLLKEYGAVN